MELVMLVCLLSEPSACREERVVLMDTVSPLACMIEAQAAIARWKAEHPAWSAKTWRCRVPGSAEIRA